MKKQFNVFVSYFWKATNDISHGYGNEVFSLDLDPDTIDGYLSLCSNVTHEFKKENKDVVILNYKKLKN